MPRRLARWLDVWAGFVEVLVQTHGTPFRRHHSIRLAGAGPHDRSAAHYHALAARHQRHFPTVLPQP